MNKSITFWGSIILLMLLLSCTRKFILKNAVNKGAVFSEENPIFESDITTINDLTVLKRNKRYIFKLCTIDTIINKIPLEWYRQCNEDDSEEDISDEAVISFIDGNRVLYINSYRKRPLNKVTLNKSNGSESGNYLRGYYNFDNDQKTGVMELEFHKGEKIFLFFNLDDEDCLTVTDVAINPSLPANVGNSYVDKTPVRDMFSTDLIFCLNDEISPLHLDLEKGEEYIKIDSISLEYVDEVLLRKYFQGDVIKEIEVVNNLEKIDTW